jgi:hypothetical protein
MENLLLGKYIIKKCYIFIDFIIMWHIILKTDQRISINHKKLYSFSQHRQCLNFELVPIFANIEIRLTYAIHI